MVRTLLNLGPVGADHHKVRFVGRVLIKLVVVLAAVAAGTALWVVGIQAGIVPHPLGPSAKAGRPMPVLP